MKWVEFSVNAPSEYVEPISEIFESYAKGGVSVEQKGGYNPDEGETPPHTTEVTVRTYVRKNSDLEDIRSRIDLGIRLLSVLSPAISLSERVLDEEEWEHEWEKYFDILEIGQNIIIVPTWKQYTPKKADVVINLNPGMAFGTGHHPTTVMCLKYLEELLKPGMNVLDVGCGSAILSIAAAKLGARDVLGIEIDPVAVKVAKSNSINNLVQEKVEVIQGDFTSVNITVNSYEIVVANISSKVISESAPQLFSAIDPGGILIASGILSDREVDVKDNLTDAGFSVKRRMNEGDWVALVATINNGLSNEDI